MLTTSLINIVIYKLLIDRNIHYSLSTTISFIIAVSFAYLINLKLVFRSKAISLKDVVFETFNFFLTRIGTYLFDLVGLIIMIEFLNLEPFFSKIFLNVLIIGMNYLLSRVVVFKDMGYP